ncbi:chorismate lyase [Glaciecola sp. MH2013]|uniref:chorismate--pyruvate lyase family protein n=1 Tax=Glaciecola sp. MH2013 TaxID=2785524 RepID=UPI0018A1206F|nr:chorismate lyase [Glaciecola sp. MH2013]MBF7073375.1 chorismate lyase [Glaciecola sp. MH2013]
MSEFNRFPIGINTTWFESQSLRVPNAKVANWLLHTGSLTERLQALTSNFRVEVVGQKTMRADESEINALPNYEAQTWQIREVILYGDNKPWVFARSVLPEHLCNTTWSSLGNQPLGQRIFNDDQFVRSDFVIAELSYNPVAALLGESSEASLWARRSQFKVHQWDLLVAEVFLPDCPCYQSEAQSADEPEEIASSNLRQKVKQ